MKEGRWYLFGLLSLFFVALSLRLILPLEFNVWGPDTGENYYIAKYFTTYGTMPSPYYGFGATYTEFPGAYQLVASIANLAGVSTAAAVELTMPFVTSLLVFPIAGIAVALTHRRSFGLMSALFYATSVVLIGHTSIMASDTLGEVILVFFLYFYISSRRDRLMTAMALVTGMAMIPTYHLGTVILLLYLYSCLLYYSFMKRDDGVELLKSLAFIIVITSLTWAFWIAEAPNFLSVFVLRNPHLTIEEAVSAPYILAFAIFIIGTYVHLKPSTAHAGTDGYRKYYYAAALSAAAAAVAYLSYFGDPSIPIYPSAYTLLNLPSVAVTLIGFTVIWKAIRNEERAFPLAIAVALLGLIIVTGLVTSIPFLVPDRIVEFVLLLAAAFTGMGLLPLLKANGSRLRKTLAVLAILSLVVSGGLSTALVAVTTTPSKIGATPAKDLSATLWLRLNTAGGSTVTSDHRLSSLVFGFAQRNATWEMGAYPIFTATSLSALESNLNLTYTPSGNKTIDYLLLDTYMIQDANFYPNQTAIPVSPAVLAYIRGSDFVQLYSNGFSEVYAYAP